MDLERLRIDRSSNRRTRNGRSRFRAWIVRGALLVLALGLIYFFRGPIVRTLDELRLPKVEVARVVERGPAEAGAVSGAAANGYIIARTRAALSADTPGRIVEINVVEGQAVKQGFVVARLYAQEYAAALRRAEADVTVGQASVRRAGADRLAAEAEVQRLRSNLVAADASIEEVRADLSLAETNFRRTSELVEEGTEPPQELDERRAALESARARLASAEASRAAAVAAVEQGKSRLAIAAAVVEEARAQLGALEAARDLARATFEKTEVRAPFDGVVVLKDAEVGEVVSPNSQAGSNARGSVATMVDFASLELQAEVPETTVAAVKVGAPARIFLDAYPGRAYRGRVDRIWPTANRQKATIEVRVAIEDPDERLRPEMGARVVFLEPGSTPDGSDPDARSVGRVLLIPADAVIRHDGADAVFVLERDVARLRGVELGERLSDRVAVIRGLEVNERVIRRPPATFVDGQRVIERNGV